MKQLETKRGQTILVDDDVYGWAREIRWFVLKRHRNHAGYAYRNTSRDGRRLKEYLHRIIMGNPPGLCIDHINRNSLDNRRSNLRIATQSQNCANQSKHIARTSHFKGVSFHKRLNRWVAVIHINRKKSHLGVFATEEAAALAYNEAAILLFGEYANLNTIPSRCEQVVRS